MPTPSSNPPPGPSSPSPYPSSTCPDDLQHPTRPSRREAHHSIPSHMDSMEVQHEPESVTASPTFPDPASRDGQAADENLTLERTTSAELSSRVTTMSPRPQSGITVSTSPAPSASDTDMIKHQDQVLGYQLSRESSVKVHRMDDRHCSFPDRESELSCHTSDEDEQTLPSMGQEYSSMRALAVSPSSYLRPGSRFHGTQQSERQVYDVQVEIKHVDMRESFLCGYLRIQGLTEDHPTLTTYFEGEIIGTKYSFFTQHDDWGANMKVDLSHWGKFSAFRPFQKHARKGPVSIPDVAQRENIFMRWKEHFLVPDHRVRTISGASFEGFYYICFNQVKGEVSGIYFHSKSEKFQQLELKHVPDWGCYSATEFR